MKAKSIKELLESSFGRRTYLSTAGVITRINPILTKTGKQMLFAKLEDFTSSMEIVVFPETLLKSQSVWKENNVVLILGKMSPRNGEAKLICESVTEL